MLNIKQIKCPNCGAFIDFIPGEKCTCKYCGTPLSVTDDNRHEYIWNDTAKVERVKLERDRFEYEKETEVLRQRAAIRRYEDERVAKQKRIKSIAIWIISTIILGFLGIIGIKFDIKLLILMLLMCSLSLGIGIMVLFSKSYKYTWIIALSLVIILGTVSIVFYFRKPEKYKEPDIFDSEVVSLPEINAYELKRKLASIGEFATSEYKYSGYSKIEDYRTVFGIDVPLTKHTVDIVYDGIIKVGYTVADIDISIKDKDIIVKLPDAEILDNYIDDYTTYEDNNIFNPTDSSEVIERLNQVKKEELNQAKKNGVYEKAEESVKKIITELFSEFSGYTIKFK